MSSERKFKSDFSKALAEVILSNEDRSKSCTVVTIDEIKETYRALCFDDPVVDSDGKCRALALTLADGMPLDPLGLDMERSDIMKLALSDPFVRGVLYTSRRDEASGKINTKKKSNDDYDDFHYNGEGIVNSANASQGYAELAFVVLVCGPLRYVKTLLSNDERGHAWICSFLGTYNGKENHPPEHLVKKEDEIHQFLHNIHDITIDETDEEKKDLSTSSRSEEIHVDDEDSLREIFAEESDPDDYDYGDDRYNIQHLQGTKDVIVPVIDPELLSKPKILSDSQIQFRIESLLHELTYNRLAYMSKKLWNAWNVSKTLVDLTLTLIHLLEDGPGHEFETLAMLYTKPLMVLRDRALDSSYGYDALDEFINLIGIFLNSEANQVGKVASKVRDDNLSPSQVIGLSALSSLCTNRMILSSSKLNERKKIRMMVFDSQNAIFDCLEVIRRQRKSANDTWVRVVLALVSILDFVTSNNVRSDFDRGFDSPLTTNESQSLIQSGLFRETLLLFMDTCDETTMTSSVAETIARSHLLRTIFIMCAQSPSILFKYASRVPALTNILYSAEFSRANMGDCILWYALLSNAQDNSESAIRLKTTIRKTKDELSDQCILSTIALFSSLQESLHQTNDADQKVISDSIWMLYILQSSSFAIDCWRSVAERDNRLIGVISGTLQSLHNVKISQESSSTDKDEKVHSNNVSRKSIITTELIAKIRKGCKYLLLTMEQSEISGKSMASRDMSSKTD